MVFKKIRIFLKSRSVVLPLVLIQCALFKEGQAQAIDPSIKDPKILLPSPNAYSLGKFGDVEVSQYTGVPSIGIPFKTIKYGDIDLTVSLNYHAGGIRVEEEASWAGLGWALNAGGVITRSIRGLDDFGEITQLYPQSKQASALGFFKTPQFPLPSGGAKLHSQGEYTMIEGGSVVSTSLGSYVRDVFYADIDGQPDLFNFNFNGKSGKFIINKPQAVGENYRIVMYGQSDIKIELLGNDLTGQSGFKITDEQGIEYWFEKLEISRSKSQMDKTGKLAPGYTSAVPDNQLPLLNRSVILDQVVVEALYEYRISSWYLTRVVSPRGAIVSLTYDTEAVFMRSLPSRSQTITRTEGSGNAGDALYSANYSVCLSETQSVYLKEISYPGFSLMVSTADRIDMMPRNGIFPRKLNSLIWNYSGVAKEKAVFEQSYFDSGTGSVDYISKRLKLQGIRIEDGSSNVQHRYRFQYYDIGIFNLPDKDSYAQDLFGFYNGKLSNDQKANFVPLMPQTVMNMFPSAIGNTSDRSVSPSHVIAGLLKRVYYPTGGSTLYEYESNDYSNGQELDYFIGNYFFINGNGGSFTSVPPSDVVNDVIVQQGAGCRIKQISNIDSDNKNLFGRRRFLYGDAVTSGKLMFGMKNFRWSNMVNIIWTLSSNTCYAMPSAASGSALGYSKVYEYVYGADQSLLGRVMYEFENEVESNDGLFCFKLLSGACDVGSTVAATELEYTSDHSTPYLIECPRIGPGIITTNRRDVFVPNFPNIVHPLNGNLKRRIVFKSSGETVLTETYSYQALNPQVVKCLGAHDFNPNSNWPSGVIFNETSAFVALTEKTVQENGVTMVTKYSYDESFKHHQVKTLTKAMSNGDEEIVNYKFYTDYDLTVTTDAASSGLRFLQDHNIIAPVELIAIQKSGGNDWLVNSLNFDYSPANGALKGINSLDFTSPLLLTSVTPTSVSSQGIMVRDSRYFMQKQIIGFNTLGRPEEIEDNAGNLRSYIWDNVGDEILAEVVNARRSQIAYTSFETSEAGGWQFLPSLIQLSSTPFGLMACTLSSSDNITRSGLESGRLFDVTYWSRNGSRTVNGTSGVVLKTQGDWQMFKHQVTPVNGIVTVSGAGQLDELRLYPSSSTMNTYLHDAFNGVVAVIDPNGSLQRFGYDSFARLTEVRDFDGNILKMMEYGYRDQVVFDTDPLFYNAQQSVGFQRNNCGVGLEGSTVYYTVPAGKYISFVSQSEVDLLASSEVSANGQNNANATGSCNPAVVNLKSTNFTNYSFNLAYTNVNTGVVYNFSVLSSSQNVSLGTIPRGTYNISIIPTSGAGNFDFIASNYYVYGVASVSATGVVINCDCGTIEISEH